MGENKYNNGKIYKIVDIGYNKCYIGSTCESLSQRMARHKQKYKSYLQGKTENTRSFFLFDEFGTDNCKIELIELYPCNSKMELLKQEGYHIRENVCVNRIISGRTNKEYRDEFKDNISKKHKEYYYENWEYHREQKKIYNEINKDKIQQKHRDYFQTNKEKLMERKLCKCGQFYTTQHIRRHEKTQKHQNYLKQTSKENEEEAPPAT